MTDEELIDASKPFRLGEAVAHRMRSLSAEVERQAKEIERLKKRIARYEHFADAVISGEEQAVITGLFNLAKGVKK